MINNYLEYAKGCREVNLHMARWAMKEGSCCEYGYAKGFYNGLKYTYDQAALDWKALQKDIEAKKKEGYDFCLVYNKYPLCTIKGSLIGGEHDKR